MADCGRAGLGSITLQVDEYSSLSASVPRIIFLPVKRWGRECNARRWRLHLQGSKADHCLIIRRPTRDDNIGPPCIAGDPNTLRRILSLMAIGQHCTHQSARLPPPGDHGHGPHHMLPAGSWPAYQLSPLCLSTQSTITSMSEDKDIAIRNGMVTRWRRFFRA